MLHNSAVNSAKQQKTPTRVGGVKSHSAHARRPRLKRKELAGTAQQPVAPQPPAGDGTGQRLDSLLGFLVLLGFILLVVIIKAFGGGRNRRLRSKKSSPPTVEKQPLPALTRSTVDTGPVVQPHQPSSRPLEGRWIPPGCAVEVCGHRINGGMVYVGAHLPQISGNGIEPALINPSLPVLESSKLWKGEEIPYWPSYSNLSPNARGLYLNWLAGGRQDPDVSIGLVFVFFYGLERRLLAETSALTDSETGLLIAEIERLLTIYGGGGSFRHYAGELRGFVKVPLWEKSLCSDPTTELDDENNWGTNLRLIAGKMAAVGHPLPAKYALKWLMKSDFLYYPPPMPAQRCREEFSRLFQIRYQQRFGAGLCFQATKRETQLQYRPASASFSGTGLTRMVNLPDVKPTTELRDLATACSNELDAYSRFLGRHPDGKSAPEGLALLPKELLGEQQTERLATLVDWLTQAVADKETATIEFQELEARWPGLHREHFGKQESVSLAECLEKLGFGIEPDIRFGSYAPSPDGKLVFFKLPTGAPSDPTPSIRTAMLTLRLGAMVLTGNEMHRTDDEEHLVGNLCASFRLNATERRRLRAKLHWLLLSKPSTLRDKKRIEILDLNQRTIIGRFLVGVTGAPGHFSPSAVRALEKVYRLLGLESNSLYSELQSASTTPITVQERDSDRRGYAIPQPFKSDGEGKGRIEIDMAKVSAMQAETERVSGLLREIFVDEEESVYKPAHAQDSILGLDQAQSEFLRRLAAKSSWSRADLEALAGEHKILLDGAIEAINEATLDALGEPLLEGETQIEVNPNILKELRL